MFIADLNNCDKEPIHIPGRIQAFGFFVATDRQGIITHCSDNISRFTSFTAADLLGKPIGAIINTFTAGVHSMGHSIGNTGDPIVGNTDNPYRILIGHEPWFLITHHTPECTLFDFEPQYAGPDTDPVTHVTATLSQLLAETQLPTLLDSISTQIRKLIQYDRVMIYRFHEDGHGEVVAEDRKQELEPWLGLHYPASDIPRQARELYKINLTRLIADVHTSPSALLTQEERPIDLTHSGLRAVSPMHIQYLQNMGVASSFSVSIMDKSALWGLIACHNYTPKFINYSRRESAKLIGQVLSAAVSFRQEQLDQLVFQRLRHSITELTRHLLRDVSIPGALLDQSTSMLDAVTAEGAALFFEGRLYTIGKMPDRPFMDRLLAWLATNPSDVFSVSSDPNGDIFSTQKLSDHLPEAEQQADSASGLLCCRLSRGVGDCMLWFRPQVLTMVKWAGDPEKPVEMVDGIQTISPRRSFAAWSQQVHHMSAPWLRGELNAARLLRDEVNLAIGRKAAELSMLNDKLKEAYAELDAFSYTISHDLKNPISAIRGFAQVIRLSATDGDIGLMAERIEERTRQITGMIDEVLQYSKVGSGKVSMNAINMQKVLTGIRQDLLAAYSNPNLSIDIEATPELQGDETMLFQVFSNLVGNAVKYSSKRAAPLVVIRGEQTATHITYSIRDNGIGIPNKDRDKIFDLFTRSVSEKEYEGTGVGLAIVKRILDRHQGEIWFESTPQQGSTFFVRFRITPLQANG